MGEFSDCFWPFWDRTLTSAHPVFGVRGPQNTTVWTAPSLPKLGGRGAHQKRPKRTQSQRRAQNQPKTNPKSVKNAPKSRQNAQKNNESKHTENPEVTTFDERLIPTMDSMLKLWTRHADFWLICTGLCQWWLQQVSRSVNAAVHYDAVSKQMAREQKAYPNY